MALPSLLRVGKCDEKGERTTKTLSKPYICHFGVRHSQSTIAHRRWHCSAVGPDHISIVRKSSFVMTCWLWSTTPALFGALDTWTLCTPSCKHLRPTRSCFFSAAVLPRYTPCLDWAHPTDARIFMAHSSWSVRTIANSSAAMTPASKPKNVDPHVYFIHPNVRISLHTFLPTWTKSHKMAITFAATKNMARHLMRGKS